LEERVSIGMTLRWRALGIALFGLVLATGVTLLGPVGPASAAGPVLKSPAGGVVVDHIPTLEWFRITGAPFYEVQVSTNAGFTNLLVNASTVSSAYVPPVQLPSGHIYWRVRAGNTGDNGWTAGAFDRAPLDVPTITGPDGSGSLAQPSNPPVVTWTPVAGAQSYTLQISTDQAFTDQNLLHSYTVQATSFVVPDLQVPSTYYMRVRTNFPGDIQSAWSAGPSQYRISGLADATLVSPTFRQTVTDVALDWKPVLGALGYDLQLDDDQSFSSPVVDARVYSTRYSPPREVPNDSYYWRVRPVDAAGNFRGWETIPVWEFTRTWAGQPTPVYPANGATVGDPFYFQWTPSEPVNVGDEDLSLASSYTVQMSDRSNFQGNLWQCATTLTTYVPQAGGCYPDAEGTYWWRILGTDDFSNGNVTRLTSAKVSHFTYAPDRITPIAPGPGDHVTVPTLSWQPVTGAAQYRVTVRNIATGATSVRDTATTTFTPRGSLPPATYEWQVQTLSYDGRLGSSYILGWPTFVVDAMPAATATLPDAVGSSSSQRFPTLHWTAVAGATNYQVWAKPSEATAYEQVGSDFTYPAGEDFTDRYLVPGDYDYFVVAFNGGASLGAGSIGHFTIEPLDEVPAAKQYAALTGNTLPDDPDQPGSDALADACSTQVLVANQQSECDNLRNTPVLNWVSQPNAGYYKLYLAHDEAMTQGVYGNQDGAAAPVIVSQTMWSPVGALPDSQANTAYYVQVVPCTYGQGCGNLASAQNAFDKLSRKAVLNAPQEARLSGTEDQVGRTVPCAQDLDPADGKQVPYCANDMTLSWQDFRNSEVSPYQPYPSPPADRPFDADTPLQTPAQTEARSYQVHVATDPGFQNIIDTAEVDQATYTVPWGTYPEGPLYWRVRALDANGNLLPWSDTGKLIKKSPVPVPTSPNDGATSVPGDTPLYWTALGSAASYHVEVYKNGDTTGSPANRVIDRTTRQRVLTLDSPLAALDTDYVWRVQRIDASGRLGDWSSRKPSVGEKWMHLRVAKPAPPLGAPADGANDVAPSDAVFTWGQAPGAMTYQWERLGHGGTTVLDAVRTPALAWAPPSSIPGGTWDWRVTAYDSSGTALGTSPARTFTVVDTVTMQNPLTITGSGRVGEPLTLDGPDWNFPAATVNTTYQWLRDGGAVSGQTALTYTVTDADLGHQVSVRATGTRDGYLTGTTTSNVIVGTAGNAPVATTSVAIQGSGKTGTTVTSTPPVWDSAAVTTSYQWQRGSTAIPGATSSTYVVTPEDVGQTLTLVATGSRIGYAPGSSTSGGIVAVLGDPAVATQAVAITGPNTRTGTLWSATPPTWNVTGVTTGYQWFRDGGPISGATGTTYRLTDADIGTSVTLRATGTRPGYQPGASTSNAVAVTPLDALVASTAPAITGVPAVKETLTATPGTWQVSSGISFTYQWFVDGQAVAKETGSSYVVRARDASLPVTVRVVSAADGWASGAATSAAVKVALMKSTTTATTTTPTITQKQRAVVNVTVGLVDYGIDLGMVQVLDGKKMIAKTALKTNSNGVVTIRLKKLKKGKHKITVVYTGNAGTQSSHAKPIIIVVTKK
jgi:hypothetical protein